MKTVNIKKQLIDNYQDDAISALREWQLQNDQEIFKSVKDGYEVSNHGRIRVTRMADKQYLNIQGKSFTTARLIYSAFNGVIDRSTIITHLDGDSGNNNLENLRAITMNENVSSKSDLPKGVRLSNSKINPYRGQIRYKNTSYDLGSFKTIEEAQNAYNVKLSELKSNENTN